ncbi:MAG: TonB-dependent receptor plug domain-containing protein [Saprospiraceae bacterium]
MRRIIFSLGFLSLNISVLYAQSDTLRALPPTEIVASQLRNQPLGAQSSTLDSAQLSLHQTENVADLLSKRSGIYVKSYGLGSLATTATRGAGASQTAIVWNGFPLQSPMLGQLDFALLPTIFVDEMTLQYGGSSTSWGSGAIGGAVLLENKTQFFNGLSTQVHLAAGSFGWQHYAAAVRYGNGKFAGSTRLFFEKAKNDFTFQIHPNLPEKRQENAALQQQGVLQEFFWNIKPGQELALRAWLQNTDREIPPTLVQNRSAATQADEFLRTSLHWKRTGKTAVFQARAAFFAEKIDYRDELIGLESLTEFHTWMGEAEATWLWGKQFRLQSSLLQTYTRAEAPAYENSPEQSRTALFAAIRREGKRWRAQLDGRLELADGALAPFTPSLGAEADVFNWLKIRGKIARNYRLPTLNDRFWRPGGNPDLLPESGWSEDLGLVFHGKNKRLRWVYSATAYSRRIENWILWAQKEGQIFFSPQNITEVWSRGLENRLDLNFHCSFGEIVVSSGYDFTRSTNEKAIKNPAIEAGSQLFYTPRHQVFGKITFRRKGFQITGFQQFTSKVAGLNESLPGFTVGSLRVQYSHLFGRWGGTFFLQLENLWDADYIVVERRPMPGRYFRAGLRAGFGRIR